jgi:hypothetical protein
MLLIRPALISGPPEDSVLCTSMPLGRLQLGRCGNGMGSQVNWIYRSRGAAMMSIIYTSCRLHPVCNQTSIFNLTLIIRSTNGLKLL